MPELEGVLDRAVERLLRRDRALVLIGLAAVTVLAWIYLLSLIAHTDMEGGMGRMTGVMSDVVKLKPWTTVDALLMFIMWAVMMVGMMVPSATPMILLYARVLRKQAKNGETLIPTSTFFAGYLTIWTGFSAAATALQWGLEQAALLSPMMVSRSPLFGGVVLILAGAYQWTPSKDTCLKHCRSPIWYLSAHWRRGVRGAYAMGLEHGVYCLGCCWALMALLFVGGVMNLLCIAGITVFVLLEKVLPHGRMIGRVGAIILVILGLAVIMGG